MVEDSSFILDDELLTRLKSAKKITILTGAGVSQESGIPTFRDAQTGLWSRYNPLELASPQAFQRNPELVWEWYRWRQGLISSSKPNPAHKAIADIENYVSQFTLITQNIDGYHQAAGSRNVIELHGNIYRTRCFNENIIIDLWHQTGELPPRCPGCGGYLRPDVVWFGEMLSPENLTSAQRASENCEVFFSIGTSGLVEPAASFPLLAKRAGANLIEINIQETPITRYANFAFRNLAGVILPKIVSVVWGTVAQE